MARKRPPTGTAAGSEKAPDPPEQLRSSFRLLDLPTDCMILIIKAVKDLDAAHGKTSCSTHPQSPATSYSRIPICDECQIPQKEDSQNPELDASALKNLSRVSKSIRRLCLPFILDLGRLSITFRIPTVSTKLLYSDLATRLDTLRRSGFAAGLLWRLNMCAIGSKKTQTKIRCDERTLLKSRVGDCIVDVLETVTNLHELDLAGIARLDRGQQKRLRELKLNSVDSIELLNVADPGLYIRACPNATALKFRISDHRHKTVFSAIEQSKTYKLQLVNCYNFRNLKKLSHLQPSLKNVRHLCFTGHPPARVQSIAHAWRRVEKIETFTIIMNRYNHPEAMDEPFAKHVFDTFKSATEVHVVMEQGSRGTDVKCMASRDGDGAVNAIAKGDSAPGDHTHYHRLWPFKGLLSADQQPKRRSP